MSGTSAAVSFGSTNVSGGGTQRILVGTTTGNVTFGATTLSGGTDAVSLQNNSAGTRTFASLATQRQHRRRIRRTRSAAAPRR